MSQSSTPIPLPPRSDTEDRLESWKEIASYLKREVRTVQRWEKTEGLPVRREQRDKLATVFAYKSELDAWRLSRQGVVNAPDPPVGNGDPDDPEYPDVPNLHSTRVNSGPPELDPEPPHRPGRIATYLLVGAVLAVLGVGG